MSELVTVLLADDDQNDVFFLQRAFAAAGITNPLQVAFDGQDAIDYLSGIDHYADRETYPLPGLLILDLKMPRKTGLDVLEWKRDQAGLCRLPAIILTSSAQRYDIERAYELGVNAFVVKPGSTSSRLELAQLIKAFWLGLIEFPIIQPELQHD